MSSVDRCLPATPDHRTRKAVLTCPGCGHASPVDGDWVVTTRENWIRVQCPDCRDQLARRPRFHDEA